MFNENNEKLEIKNRYENGDRIMTLDGARGEIKGIIFNRSVPVYAVQFDGEKKARACSEWRIAGAIEQDVPLRDKVNEMKDEMKEGRADDTKEKGPER